MEREKISQFGEWDLSWLEILVDGVVNAAYSVKTRDLLEIAHKVKMAGFYNWRRMMDEAERLKLAEWRMENHYRCGRWTKVVRVEVSKSLPSRMEIVR